MSDLIVRPVCATLPGAADEVCAGEWWEFRGSPETFPEMVLRAGALPPSKPLRLLVTDVRVHDGQTHSVHLARHPSWEKPGKWDKGGADMRFLAEDFFRDFVRAETREAEAGREAEIAAHMELVGAVQRRISAGPDESEIAEGAKRIGEAQRKAEYEAWKSAEIQRIWKRAGSDKEAGRRLVAEIPSEVPSGDTPGARVPAALLPGGDVAATKARIEGHILRMRASEAWITSQIGAMSATMAVIGDFQTEKVGAVTAAISIEMRKAQDLLTNVETMNLFLGKGCALEILTEGVSAPADAPLHLMQRMLYLDEELFVEGRFADGFNGDDLADLPAVFSKNPGLVTRMMPHQRCVTIAKVRRHDRPFAFAGSSAPEILAEVFEKIRQSEADARIFLFVRDGGNVRMVIADEHTSKAGRLFPSAAEIRAIYSGKDGEIGVNDIEYSDRRNRFDERALFYKRFLLLLWGLHEREDAFGPFMGKGLNWLRESVTNDRFVFVHDEEGVLPDDLGSVGGHIDALNAVIAPGSLVMVNTAIAFGPDSAPGSFRYAKERYERLRVPTKAFVLAKVARRGHDLIVQIPTRKDVWSEAPKTGNSPMVVVSGSGKVTQGVLCLDIADSGRILRHIESRASRETYLEWLETFARSVPEIRAREEAEGATISRVIDLGASADDAMVAAAFVRRTKRSGLVDTGDAPRILGLTVRMAQARLAEGDDPIVIDRTGTAGRIVTAADEDGYVPGWFERVTLEGRREAVSSSAASLENRIVVRGRDRISEMARQVAARANRHLLDPDDVSALLEIDSGLALRLFAGADLPDESETSLERFASFVSPNGFIHYPFMKMTVGAAVCRPADGAGKRDYRIEEDLGRTRIFELTIDMFLLMARNGRRDAVADLIGRRAKSPQNAIADLDGEWLAVTSQTRMSQAGWGNGLHELPGARAKVEAPRIVMSCETRSCMGGRRGGGNG